MISYVPYPKYLWGILQKERDYDCENLSWLFSCTDSFPVNEWQAKTRSIIDDSRRRRDELVHGKVGKVEKTKKRSLLG